MQPGGKVKTGLKPGMSDRSCDFQSIWRSFTVFIAYLSYCPLFVDCPPNPDSGRHHTLVTTPCLPVYLHNQHDYTCPGTSLGPSPTLLSPLPSIFFYLDFMLYLQSSPHLHTQHHCSFALSSSTLLSNSHPWLSTPHCLLHMSLRIWRGKLHKWKDRYQQKFIVHKLKGAPRKKSGKGNMTWDRTCLFKSSNANSDVTIKSLLSSLSLSPPSSFSLSPFLPFSLLLPSPPLSQIIIIIWALIDLVF